MIETMQNDYILSAWASGFSEKQVIYRFALRNTLLPLITYLGLSLGIVLGGSPIAEWIISWPGLGLYAFKALRNYDYIAITAACMIVTILILLVNLATDIAYSIIHPRIRLEWVKYVFDYIKLSSEQTTCI